MRNELDIEAIRSKIRNVEDATLKSITDIVAFKISKSPDDMGAEDNFHMAEQSIAEYVSENFNSMEGFYDNLSKLGKGTKGMQAFADVVYEYCSEKDYLSFDVVKKDISSRKDITLKTITDLVAHKILESSNNKDADVDFITAQTFVAEYVSKNYKNKIEFEKKISKLGKDMKGLNAFAEIVYKHFIEKDI